MADHRQQHMEELTRLASLMRGVAGTGEVFAVYLSRIEAVEAGASALAREQEMLEALRVECTCRVIEKCERCEAIDKLAEIPHD